MNFPTNDTELELYFLLKELHSLKKSISTSMAPIHYTKRYEDAKQEYFKKVNEYYNPIKV